MLTKINHLITTVSDKKIIFIGTLLVLSGSIPLVYLASLIGGVEYSGFLLVISIVLPLLLAPLTIAAVIKLTINLEHVKKHLEREIAKNKAKDILLYEQARFALMGEMLANISHQWKQPLNTINLAVIDARMQFDDAQKRERDFDIVEENVNYLAATINDFMSYFDKKRHSEIRNLEEIIVEIKSIAGASIKNSGASLKITVVTNDKEIRVASSLSQILLNLINNAKDALCDKEGAREISLRFFATSNKFFIECCDNGSGIDASIREQIFNPYFTTKAQSQGTGIGLYMSRQITDNFFQGSLVLESTPDGTCFKVTIPTGENCYIKDKN